MLYLCLTKEERAASTVVFSSFFAKMPREKGLFTSDIGKNTSDIEKFLPDVRFFFSEMDEKIAEVMLRNVKENFSAKVQF